MAYFQQVMPAIMKKVIITPETQPIRVLSSIPPEIKSKCTLILLRVTYLANLLSIFKDRDLKFGDNVHFLNMESKLIRAPCPIFY